MGCYAIHAECLSWLRQQPDNHFDLVFTSPPYENARKLDGVEIHRGEAWVEWALERYMECVRVCRGLVAWVVDSPTKDFRWTATPALLMADLHRSGVGLRKPPLFRRVGIPGSGGPDWWRSDYEFTICATKGRLPWANNTATGQPPKFAPGGAMSHRKQSGERVDAVEAYTPPKIANPGNVVQANYTAQQLAEWLAEPCDVLDRIVGGGHMGSPLAFENEAPFPESLAEAYIRSFCPPGGLVLDPFCGSGTTLAVAQRLDRNAIGLDVRHSQIVTTTDRLLLG